MWQAKGSSRNLKLIVAIEVEMSASLEKYRRFTAKVGPVDTNPSS